MKIAFDLRRIKNPGIGRYMKCLVEAVVAHAPEHEYLLLMPPNGEDLVSAGVARVEKISPVLKYYSVREQIELPRILRRHQVDLLHSPHFLLPLSRPCPAVVTIHDVIYLACRDDLPSQLGQLYYRTMMHASARLASTIITDSIFSKNEIVHYLNIDPAKVAIIYPAVASGFGRVSAPGVPEAVLSKHAIDRDYILYTGIYKPRKNHAGLLRAFKHFLADGGNAQLVIAGPLNEGERYLRNLAEELNVAKHVVLTGFVEDSELDVL